MNTNNQRTMNELALFAGAGGGILGGKLLGWRTVCAVELDGYAQRVLQARQDDHCLAPFPIWDDITTFDGKPWNGVVDIVTGGFPCQDISAAGKGAGIGGARSGLWGHMARIIGEVGPRYVLVENSPLLTGRGLWRVLGDLASLGYDARWGVLGAHHAGAPHKRDRIWIRAEMANAKELFGDGCNDHTGECERPEPFSELGNSCRPPYVANPTSRLSGEPTEREGRQDTGGGSGDCGRSPGAGGLPAGQTDDWWKAEPELGRVADGVANRTHRLRCLGNGQVPAVVRLAWHTLTQ